MLKSAILKSYAKYKLTQQLIMEKLKMIQEMNTNHSIRSRGICLFADCYLQIVFVSVMFFFLMFFWKCG